MTNYSDYSSSFPDDAAMQEALDRDRAFEAERERQVTELKSLNVAKDHLLAAYAGACSGGAQLTSEGYDGASRMSGSVYTWANGHTIYHAQASVEWGENGRPRFVDFYFNDTMANKNGAIIRNGSSVHFAISPDRASGEYTATMFAYSQGGDSLSDNPIPTPEGMKPPDILGVFRALDNLCTGKAENSSTSDILDALGRAFAEGAGAR